MTTLLSVRNLTVQATTYPPRGEPQRVTLVDRVSFDLQKSKVLGLIGESGAGKSTIGLAALAYLRGGAEITGGEVLLDGIDIFALEKSAIRKIRGARLSYVSQSAAAAFNPARRLGEQVIEATVRHKLLSRGMAKNRAVYLFRVLGLPDPNTFGDRYPHQVSGGQLQRAMTAMALCANPELIVFDEPTTALDVTTQLGVLSAIKKAIQTTCTAALYITHDIAVVAQIADDVMVLRNGKTVEYGTVEQIVHTPRQEYTRALVNISRSGRRPATNQSTALLRVEHVSAMYRNGVEVLSNVSLQVQKGQTLAIVGESGSGKSTLARVITGLLPPTKGTLWFDGKPLTPETRKRPREDLRRIQLIYQTAETAMNPHHKVRDIIGRPVDFYHGLRGAANARRVSELLNQVALDDGFADRFPSQLSGGQLQRVAIARAFAADPELIICDEPTSALDPLVADEILELLMRLQKQSQISYLFITHDISIVRAIADSVAVMHRGKVVRLGPTSTVFSPPFDAYTDLLMKSVPTREVGWLEKVTMTNCQAMAKVS
jgi:peptide/nickel transport system ATP-binding protein